MERSGVDNEQISSNNNNNCYPYYPHPNSYPYPYPPPPPSPYFMHGDPNWHYPYPAMPYYYNPYHEYDSKNYSDYYHNAYNGYQDGGLVNNDKSLINNNNNNIHRNTPNIIVTSTGDDDNIVGENKETNNSIDHNLETNGLKNPALQLLSQNLNEIIKPDFDSNLSKDDKKYVGDRNKVIQNSEDGDCTNISPSPSNEKSSEIENNSEEEDDLLSSSSESESEKAVVQHDNQSADGLKAIKSVSNIKVYDTEDEAQSCPKVFNSENSKLIQEKENYVLGGRHGLIQIQDLSDDDDIDSLSSESEGNNANEVLCENSDSDDGAEELTEDIEEVTVPEELSVIYEESEADGGSKKVRPISRSNSVSTLSDCSTTIANDDDGDNEKNPGTIQPGDEENSSLVTVRLPLRLSFSRSSNDENITTVVVGDSEIEDDKSHSEHIDDRDGDDNDVSVTFSITSRSSSFDQSGLLDKITSPDQTTSNKDCFENDDDTDSEVSVRVSLPMKRDKFMTQTLVGDVTNNISSFKSPFDSENSEDECEEEDSSKHDLPLLPIVEEKEEFEFQDREDIFNKEIIKQDRKDIIEEDDQVEEVEEEVEEEEEAEEDFEAEKTNDLEFKARDVHKLIEQNDVKKNKIVKENASDEESEEDEGESDSDEETETDSEEDQPHLAREKPIYTDQDTGFVFRWRTNDERKLFAQPPSTFNYTMDQQEINDRFDYFNSRDECETTQTTTTEEEETEEPKISVRDRIAAFEATNDTTEDTAKKQNLTPEIITNNTTEKKKVLSRNSSLQKSESELEEDDSGVTSDMSKPISETDTEPEGFPELRKMTRYQRAATHSRLFKLLQEESGMDENETSNNDDKVETLPPEDELQWKPRKKIVHNVSITRKQNPDAIKDAETMSERRERLSLPLKMNTSIDADNVSSSNSPSSPTSSTNVISDKLVNELVQSLLLKKKSQNLRNLPMEKLQAAAKRVLEEEIDSWDNTSSMDSTPALTPQEFKNEYQNSYSDYYDTWNDTLRRGTSPGSPRGNFYDILPSKAFKTLQEQSISGQKKLWAARCPRILSSKTINRDLARVTESRESESPESFPSTTSRSSSSATPEKCISEFHGESLSRLGTV